MSKANDLVGVLLTMVSVFMEEFEDLFSPFFTYKYKQQIFFLQWQGFKYRTFKTKYRKEKWMDGWMEDKYIDI